MAAEIMNIGQIGITVKDVKRAAGFYRDKVGLKFLFDAGNMAFFDCGGVRLMLAPPEPDRKTYSSILYFRVAGITQAHAELQAKGVKFIHEPHLIARMPDHELWLAEFYDSEGNAMALMSEVRSGEAKG